MDVSVPILVVQAHNFQWLVQLNNISKQHENSLPESDNTILANHDAGQSGNDEDNENDVFSFYDNSLTITKDLQRPLYTNIKYKEQLKH